MSRLIEKNSRAQTMTDRYGGRYCAPTRGAATGGGRRTPASNHTCYSSRGLVKLAQAYNSARGKEIIVTRNKSPDQIWAELRSQLSSQCSNEICWMDRSFASSLKDDPDLKDTFLPKRDDPSDPWLSTKDIGLAMQQYERIHPNFQFLGPVPLNFAELVREVAALDLRQAQSNGKQRIGVVFNLEAWEPGVETGSHWVAVFIQWNESKPTVEYFNSEGTCPPPRQIREFLDNMTAQLTKLTGKRPEVMCNTRRHQYSKTECGVYCMFFLVQRLKGKSFSSINRRITDEEMAAIRDQFHQVSDHGGAKSWFG